MLSSLTVSVKSGVKEEEYTIIIPSLSELKMIQCLQAIFQLVLKSTPKLQCRNVTDLLSKSFSIDQVSWEPPDSVYQEREEQGTRQKKISLSDLGDIPLTMFHEVMEKFETGVGNTEHDEVVSLSETTEEDPEAFDVDDEIKKVYLADYKLPKFGEKTCPVCGKSFQSWAEMSHHFVQHNREPEKFPFYFCDVCRQWATNKIEIETHKHLALAHSEGQKQKPSFKCGECHKEFRLKHQLETHSLVHSGLKQFGCEKCGKLFKQIGEN